MGQRQPARLHQDPLLRVHSIRLLVRYCEEAGVKDVDALNLPLVPAIAHASRDCSLLVVVIDVGVNVEACSRDLQEAVAATVPDSRPELLVHVRAARVPGGQARDDDLVASWGRWPRRSLPLKQLGADTRAFKLELQRLGEVEALERQGLALRLVVHVVLLSDEHHQAVGSCRHRDLCALGRLGNKPHFAVGRAKEVQQGHALPAHHGQESISLPRLWNGRQVPRFIRGVHERHPQHEVRAAENVEAEALLHVRLQHLRKHGVALVLSG
mmetsp:Transcript_58539/g.181302  ORF Transcript_58539/g.181302 Transcript_58539/m.181302 type:complete len:269 (-) Transcript_58539:596-1402(-)